jgi:cytochrome c oxidase subunit II
MPFPRASAQIRRALLGLSLASVLLVSGCYAGPQTTVHPKSDAGQMIQDLYVLIFWLSVVVFVAVQGVLLFIMWRYRSRPGHELPEQVHGNTRLEVMWTIAPAIILVIMAVPTIQTIFAIEGAPPVSASSGPNPPGAMQIEVIGHQWWWEFRYPEQGIITANEMIIPVGRTVELKMRSEDVIHSFWIPQLMGKQDVVPAHTNALWFTASEPGQYFGQCAEYCGIQHALMRMNVIAYNQPDFQAWVARQQQPATPSTELAQTGAEIFQRSACVGCHTIQGTSAQGRIGPELSHFGSRTTLASGILTNTPEHLAEWLRDPQAVKAGNKMPTLNLPPNEVDALVEYLHSLK